MSLQIENPAYHIHKDDREGLLAIQAPGMFVTFSADTRAQAYADSDILGGLGLVYPFGFIETKPPFASEKVWKLGRTDDKARRLVPQEQTQLSERLEGSILVVPENNADELIDRLRDFGADEDWPPSGMQAERLYRRAAGIMLLGSEVAGCATYSPNVMDPRLVYVNAVGGYAVGFEAAPERAGELSVPETVTESAGLVSVRR